MTSYEERAAARIDKYTERSDDGCWLWVGTKNLGGYGQIYFRDKPRIVTRVVWELANGPIPEGMLVCHRCDVRACVRLDHLFLGTHADNTADMRGKGRAPSPEVMAAAIRAGWTPEKRRVRAELMRSRRAAEHDAAAAAAGVPVDWKFCPVCNRWKPRSGFHRNSARYDGLKSRCKPCSLAEGAKSTLQRSYFACGHPIDTEHTFINTRGQRRCVCWGGRKL